MKTIGHILLAALLGLGVLTQAAETEKTTQTAETPKSPAILLQEAIYQEETAGDLDKAIELYGQVLEQAADVERLAARATYQLGLCHLKKGDETAAADYFRKAVQDYPKQTSVVKKAQQKLAKLNTATADSGPQVISTSPVALADDVDPALDKITVTFNTKMMDGSWSWTGGGDTYPQSTGKPYYDETRTTCTLPVKLEPGKFYWVGINSPSHKNFKNANREPAKRYVILFATKTTDGKPTPIPDDMRTQTEAINGPNSDKQKTEDTQKALDAAQAWLDLVDKEQYDQSWDNTCSLFKKVVTKSQCVSSFQAARSPFGVLISRKVLSKTYTRQLPGAPDGEYVVITFKASYENKKEAIETVTPMLDSDGQWRVSGYFIK